jgi:hypothetical protein
MELGRELFLHLKHTQEEGDSARSEAPDWRRLNSDSEGVGEGTGEVELHWFVKDRSTHKFSLSPKKMIQYL